MGAFLRRYRAFFLYAGFFSFFINLLLLVPALFMLQVFDRVLASRHEETLVLLTILTVGALLTMMVLEVIRLMLLARAAVTVDKQLGPKLLATSLHSARDPAASENLLGMRDLATLRSFLAGPGILALFDVPWLPVYLLVIFLFHPLMGVVATLGALALFALARLNERLTRTPLERLQEAGRRAGRFVDEGLRNATVVGALGMVAGLTRAWSRLNQNVIDSQLASSYRAAQINAAIKFMRQFVQVAMLGTGAWLVIERDVSPGVMIAATILLGRALAPMETMIAGWRSLVDARNAAARLREVIDARESPEQPTALPASKGELTVDKVTFIRAPNHHILKGVSFTLRPGESLAILGPSAAGKSTLARLIVGVWKPTTGIVRLDGADVSAWERGALGPHIGYLPQDVELFAGTVSANIRRLGERDDEAVTRAAMRAHAHRMILQLPNGYDTEIGEGGRLLSGGQRQRIALARALYGSPRLVVLDEPNANLDEEGELALMHTIRALREEQVTVVLVTHRPAIVAKMDKVLVLREGAVAFYGPTTEFLAKVTLDNRLRERSRIVQRNRNREA